MIPEAGFPARITGGGRAPPVFPTIHDIAAVERVSDMSSPMDHRVLGAESFGSMPMPIVAGPPSVPQGIASPNSSGASAGSYDVARRIERTAAILESLCAASGSPQQTPLGPDSLSLAAVILKELREPFPPLDYPLPAGFLVSVVIPIYNEQNTAARILARVLRLPFKLQVILVDDHSTDHTVEALRPFLSLPELELIAKPANEGKGAALRTGFAHAKGDVVIIQDADLEYDPRDIPQVIRPIAEGTADVVFGSRFLTNSATGSSPLHQWGNHLLTAISNHFTGLRLTDMETCYKAFRRELLRTIPLQQDRFGFEPEITAKVARRGARLTEVPIHYDARAWDEGKKIGLRDAVNALYCVVRYAWTD